MRILLTNNFDRWIQGCDVENLDRYVLPNFLDASLTRIHRSDALRDRHLSSGVSAALVDYEFKRRLPYLVTIANAKLVCLSIPTANNELEEHYYFCNNYGEWLTENPFLAEYQYWFIDVERSTEIGSDYHASLRFPIDENSNSDQIEQAVFLGGRMNWTHWNIDCLAPLLLLSPTTEECLLTSRLNSWQLDGLNFFGYINRPRLQISHGNGFSMITMNKLRFSWNFHQIDRFAFLRQAIAKLSPGSISKSSSKLICPDFTTNHRVHRVANATQLQARLSQIASHAVHASSLSYADKLATYYDAQSILTLPGSDSINGLLFANDDAKIIQMIPWPNSLMSLSKYSLIVAYCQIAYQTCLNVTPFYGFPINGCTGGFDDEFHYPLSKLDKILSIDCFNT